ncbi:2-dehydropantoate 2-reductase [Lichtheimia corymbifera JMRC:FSU:9682]|uniref:2-dehydropantoate 2-reductase n=1 Tax=Lichtheimia corymbifera JMRC:FSU:9682 TaxID=1263082 RepID=A0A068S7M1_9FUNG|nr:2-dehydropantoate 2-reductase [Lichtheimia corymbifera JMRC:FSU:9682]
MRFHILGTGAIGCHVASVLRPRHPITLLLRSNAAVKAFKEEKNSTVIYNRSDKQPIKVSGFDAEPVGSSLQSPIEALFVATKSQHAVDAVRSVQPRLSRSSTLVLLQNGMGLAEELLDKLWPSTETAPSIIIGVNRHAIERMEPFSVTHYSGWDDQEGGLMLGSMPHSVPENTTKVLDAIAHFEEFNCKIFPWEELRRRMMRKLVVNASINPVAALLGVKNGALHDNPGAEALLRGVCQEAHALLPELNTTADELMDMVQKTVVIAGGNSCSTLQDLRAKRLTEVDYINGYLLKLARDRGIAAPVNEYLTNMIHAKERVLGAK